MLESLFSANRCAQLNRFAHEAWGNPDAVLSRSGDVEFIDLQDYPVLQEMLAGPVYHDKILIIDEYRIALQELETEMYHGGAYVTGQPGIGKTLFLIYVLVVRLGQKRACVLQFPDSRLYYVIFHNSVTVHSLNDRIPLDEFPSVWALTDSNKRCESPSGISLGGGQHIRVIQTTAPETFRWRWSKQTGAECYVVDIWSEKDIANFAELRGLDVQRMTFLVERWGCVPRSLLRFIFWKDPEIEFFYRETTRKAVVKCRDTVLNAQFNDASSHIFFCRPWIIGESGISRKMFRATVVPTPTILIDTITNDLLARETVSYRNTFNPATHVSRSGVSVQGLEVTKLWLSASLAPSSALVNCVRQEGPSDPHAALLNHIQVNDPPSTSRTAERQHGVA